jgi:hypothetical protein
MVKLKKYRVSKEICNVCKGNGYVKVVHVDYKNHIHQCWECDSEGEYYVYAASINEHSDDAHGTRNTYKFLH